MGINILADAEALSHDRACISLGIVSDVRFIREALVDIFTASGRVKVIGAVAEFDESFDRMLTLRPDIVLVDTSFPSALVHVRRIKKIAPRLHIIALALADREDDVIAWAEFGIRRATSREPRGSTNCSLFWTPPFGESSRALHALRAA